MLKKLITYQRLLLNSTPPFDMNSNNPFELLLTVFGVFAVVFMNIYVFAGNAIFTNSNLTILLPMASLWMNNRIMNGSNRLFETVPVSRKYIVLNVFLLSIVITVIFYLMYIFSIITLLGTILGIAYLVNSKSITSSPETAVKQIIDTTKGNLLMLCVLVIILFAGVLIIFIKNKRNRLFSFTGLVATIYGLLFFLKINMPISPNTGKVEFLESFSIMPQGNSILFCIATATVLICITSVFLVYKLYVTKANQ